MEPTRGKVDLSSIGIDTAKLNDAKVSVTTWGGRHVTIQDAKGQLHTLTMKQFVKVVDNNVAALIQVASHSTTSSEQNQALTKARSLIEQAKKLDLKATEKSTTGLKSYKNEFKKIEKERMPGRSSDYENNATSLLNQINQHKNDKNSNLSDKERLAHVNTLINEYNETIQDWKEMWRDEYINRAKESKLQNHFSPLPPLDTLPNTEKKIDNIIKQSPLSTGKTSTKAEAEPTTKEIRASAQEYKSKMEAKQQEITEASKDKKNFEKELRPGFSSGNIPESKINRLEDELHALFGKKEVSYDKLIKKLESELAETKKEGLTDGLDKKGLKIELDIANTEKAINSAQRDLFYIKNKEGPGAQRIQTQINELQTKIEGLQIEAKIEAKQQEITEASKDEKNLEELPTSTGATQPSKISILEKELSNLFSAKIDLNHKIVDKLIDELDEVKAQIEQKGSSKELEARKNNLDIKLNIATRELDISRTQSLMSLNVITDNQKVKADEKLTTLQNEIKDYQSKLG